VRKIKEKKKSKKVKVVKLMTGEDAEQERGRVSE
jgi:hypothetical protein